MGLLRGILGVSTIAHVAFKGYSEAGVAMEQLSQWYYVIENSALGC